MPNYRYVCVKCNYSYNDIRAANEAHIAKQCPFCGVELKQAYTPPAIKLHKPK